MVHNHKKVFVFSALLDNVTTILLDSSVTTDFCKVLDLEPVPLATAEVMFPNIGGAVTKLVIRQISLLVHNYPVKV